MNEASGATLAAADAMDVVMRRLEKRGWSLVESDDFVALAGDPHDHDDAADTVESDLLNTDLRSVGAKSLPYRNSLRSMVYLVGPMVLQVSEVRDISRSSIEDGSMNSSRNHMLRFALTDGYNQVTAVECTLIVSIDGGVVSGTKVHLERKVPLHNGILCLNATALTVLGGIVQSLHEDWHVNKKYSPHSRESLGRVIRAAMMVLRHLRGCKLDNCPSYLPSRRSVNVTFPLSSCVYISGVMFFCTLRTFDGDCAEYSESTSCAHGYDRGQHSGAVKNRSIAERKTLEVKQDMKDISVGNYL